MSLITFSKDKDELYPVAQLLGVHQTNNSFEKDPMEPEPVKMFVSKNPWSYYEETSLNFNDSDILTNNIGITDPATGGEIKGYVYSDGDVLFAGQKADTKSDDYLLRTLKDCFWIHFKGYNNDFINNRVFLEIGDNQYDHSTGVPEPGIGLGDEMGNSPETFLGTYTSIGYYLDLDDYTTGDSICVWVRYTVPKNEQFGRFFDISVKFETNIDY